MQVTNIIAENISNIHYLRVKKNEEKVPVRKTWSSDMKQVDGIYYRQFSLNFGSGVYSEKVSPDDFQTQEMIYKLDNAAFGDMISFPDVAAFIQFNQQEGANTYLVKNKKNAILGYYMFKWTSKDNLCIDTINLLPEYQGKHTGFTSYVFSQADENARQNGATKISLYVLPENKKAINLYKRHGFKILNLKTDVYDKDVYYMEKNLS